MEPGYGMRNRLTGYGICLRARRWDGGEGRRTLGDEMTNIGPVRQRKSHIGNVHSGLQIVGFRLRGADGVRGFLLVGGPQVVRSGELGLIGVGRLR